MKNMMKKLVLSLLCAALMITLLPAIGAKAAPENYGCDKWYEVSSYAELIKYVSVEGDACEATGTTKRIGIRLKKDITLFTDHLGIDDAIYIPRTMGLVIDFNGNNLYITETNDNYVNSNEFYDYIMVEGSLRLVDTHPDEEYISGIYWQSEARRGGSNLIDISVRRGASVSVYDGVMLNLEANSKGATTIYHGAGTVLLYDAYLNCFLWSGGVGHAYYAYVTDADMKLRMDQVYMTNKSYQGQACLIDTSEMNTNFDCCMTDVYIDNDVLSENIIDAISIYGGKLKIKDIVNPTSTVMIFDPVIQDLTPISLDDPEYRSGIYSYDSGAVVMVGAFPDDVFVDISESAWYYDNVRYVANRNLMTGTDATHFAPAKTLNRAQFATVLYRMAGSPKVTYKNIFPDVPKGTFFSDAAIWASEQGIITGYTAGANAGKFGPGNNITREQMATMMYRYAQATGYPVTRQDDISKFSDANKVSGFALDAMKWAYDSGIIGGKSNGTLAPQGNAVRAECAAIIQRYLYSYDYHVD